MRPNVWRWWKNRVNSNLSLKNWIEQAQAALTAKRPHEPRSSIYALLEKHIERSRAYILSHPEHSIDENTLSAVEHDLGQLLHGEPLAYILGEWEFFGLPLQITPDVLIPRPETELLVENSLHILKKREKHAMIADVGTGSACISLALAVNNANLKIIASDISHAALQIAKANIQQHHCQERVFLVQCDLLEAVVAQFDLICANLPYIPSAELHNYEVTAHEPELALDGGLNGIVFIDRLLQQAKNLVREHACILLEFQFDQAERIREHSYLHFPNADVIIKQDLAGHDRLAIIQL